ncbi:phosphoribosylamine--glycine ligase [Granulicella rosea]|uniref:Phosphoribosylamine--glycine ligase n=1 Tax=Granulicella rosea TaxID=474952 RepID=A0A239DED4_9BACT|nr:phosphoribosylamine--glycine ligase [Granulicella rosea]SNS30739.1 phosphoribosylamine--glycine ligase [Granulicella rosea]
MKILVIGGGGREHAVVWALSRSARVSEIVCAPGNGGIAALARCVPLDVSDLDATIAVVGDEQPELVVVGPEVPLSLGLVDELTALGVRAFGPTRAAARLESSKGFAKEFMQRHGIPTAGYAVCANYAQAEAALERFAPEVVVKADGLAAGKGVVICANHEEALAAASGMFGGALLGSAVPTLVIEEFLTGPEVSFFAVCDGFKAVTLAAAQDHKRVGEGDTGPNTGGMGAYSTDTLITPEMSAWLLENVAQKVVDGMRQEGTPFQGILFCGIMMTPAGPMVLEFNTRFGDPETQAILLRLETDLLAILEASIDGRAAELEIKLKPGASACVIAASGGYPGKYRSGLPIAGLEGLDGDGRVVFHSGTALVDGATLTAGGRVLAVTAVSHDLKDALAKAYEALDAIRFEGMQFRRDIGWRALEA